jgi:hypothetical protein
MAAASGWTDIAMESTTAEINRTNHATVPVNKFALSEGRKKSRKENNKSFEQGICIYTMESQ